MTAPSPPSVAQGAAAPARRRLPAIVWATAWVSFFTDLSTEMIFGVLPAFYQATFALSVAGIGMVEGAAETIVSLTRLFSGHLSDRTGGRKWWMAAGYSLSTLAKPLLGVAHGEIAVGALRGADRLGKGLRGAPRDALLSREIAADQRGRAFGIQRAMDHAGALAGGLLASLLLYLAWVEPKQLFWWSLLPGGLAVLIILLCVHEREPQGQISASGPAPPRLGAAWREQSATVKRYLLVLGVFALGNSSDMLLLALAYQQFRAVLHWETSTATAALPLLWAWLHVIKALSTPWGGALSDRIGRARLVQAGWLIYAGVYGGFALWGTTGWGGAAAPWGLFAVYGVYSGLTEGPERALVADLAPDPARRGMAYGLFHFIAGIAALPASALCGVLWYGGGAAGPALAFGVGAGLALVAAVMLPWALRQ